MNEFLPDHVCHQNWLNRFAAGDIELIVILAAGAAAALLKGGIYQS